MRVVGAGAGFGVILHAEQRQIAVAQAFECLVVQVHVREFDFGLRQRVGIDGEVVVVGGDLDLAGVELFDGMIAAVVSEFQLEGFAAQSDAGQLVAETDAEDGLASHKAADVVHGIRARLGIARAVREKDTVWFEREDVFGRSLRRDDSYAAALTT